MVSFRGLFYWHLPVNGDFSFYELNEKQKKYVLSWMHFITETLWKRKEKIKGKRNMREKNLAIFLYRVALIRFWIFLFRSVSYGFIDEIPTGVKQAYMAIDDFPSAWQGYLTNSADDFMQL